MTEPYTPTTAEVRSAYRRAEDTIHADVRQPYLSPESLHAEFDRWWRAELAIQARFWTKVERNDDETCWLWTGNKNSNGYGMARIAGVQRSAHLFAYEWLVGPVPPGLEIDHKCRVRDCVNPRHLEAVTHRENMVRAAAVKRFCPRGHPLVEGNLVPSVAKRRARQCLTCSREMAREYRARKKAEK